MQNLQASVRLHNFHQLLMEVSVQYVYLLPVLSAHIHLETSLLNGKKPRLGKSLSRLHVPNDHLFYRNFSYFYFVIFVS